VIAAGLGGWLGLAFGLWLLLATVLQAVSGCHLPGSPRVSGRTELRKMEHSAWFGSHTCKGWENWASSATAVAEMNHSLILGLCLSFPTLGS